VSVSLLEIGVKAMIKLPNPMAAMLAIDFIF